MARFACNLKGECEANLYVGHNQLDNCQAVCQPTDLDQQERELMFITLSYDPESSLLLAPSDQVDYLKREYGVTVSAQSATTIATALYSNNYVDLYRRGMIDYLESRLIRKPPRELDPLDFLLLRLLVDHPDLGAVNFDLIKAEVVLICGRLGASGYFGRFRIVGLPLLHTWIIRTTYEVAAKALPVETPRPEWMGEYLEYLTERFG